MRRRRLVPQHWENSLHGEDNAAPEANLAVAEQFRKRLGPAFVILDEKVSKSEYAPEKLYLVIGRRGAKERLNKLELAAVVNPYGKNRKAYMVSEYANRRGYPRGVFLHEWVNPDVLDLKGFSDDEESEGEQEVEEPKEPLIVPRFSFSARPLKPLAYEVFTTLWMDARLTRNKVGDSYIVRSGTLEMLVSVEVFMLLVNPFDLDPCQFMREEFVKICADRIVYFPFEEPASNVLSTGALLLAIDYWNNYGTVASPAVVCNVDFSFIHNEQENDTEAPQEVSVSALDGFDNPFSKVLTIDHVHTEIPAMGFSFLSDGLEDDTEAPQGDDVRDLHGGNMLLYARDENAGHLPPKKRFKKV
jgi:hypothetical protein